MTRFKRTLCKGYEPPASVPRRVARRDPILHEGFAIPGHRLSESQASEANPEPVGREGPEARPYARGSYDKAMAFARCPAACRSALLAEAVASTSRGPTASRIKRWEQLGRQCQFPDPFDLTPDVIYAIMGALKLAEYRSAEQYLEAAKQVFIREGGEWTSQLRQAARAAVRSCKRGQGCPKQAKGLPMVRLPEILDSVPLVKGGPVHLGRATILASWWRHITLDTCEHKVTWKLPSSKADWRALGAEHAPSLPAPCVLTTSCRRSHRAKILQSSRVIRANQPRKQAGQTPSSA
eukprot:s254_g42.t1